jgi:hypothetical protein
VDHWLARQKRISEEEAKQLLLRRYLGAYGPATVSDFSKWSGMLMKEASPLWRAFDSDLIEVSIGDKKASVLREDREQLSNAILREPVLRVLPSFDPYLLAHAEKDHLVDRAFYKRVYRDQGWISPVLLLNGRVIGIWSATPRGKGGPFDLELFQKVSKATRAKIEEETASLAEFVIRPQA